jgi:hypothetical protein
MKEYLNQKDSVKKKNKKNKKQNLLLIYRGRNA